MKVAALVGVGNVGKEVEAQLCAQPLVRVVAVCNSRLMLLGKDGVSSSQLHTGQPLDVSRLIDFLGSLEVPVLVDCTASDSFPDCYGECVARGVRVVAANKAIFERDWGEVSSLVASPLFAYEATCGAGLPIISTVKRLLAAGDTVKSVEGLLSGTLAFVFSQLEQGTSFSAAVLDAKAKGYTEPDPRDDLSGKDVQRKLMVLARTLHLPIDISEVQVRGLVPEQCADSPLFDFLASGLQSLDADMERQRTEAEQQGAVLRFVAEIHTETASAFVGLKAVPKSAMLAAAQGTDNVFHIVTKRYPRGLTISGAGAGAEVTAMGVVTDILG